jgi:hypothetical protein
VHILITCHFLTSPIRVESVPLPPFPAASVRTHGVRPSSSSFTCGDSPDAHLPAQLVISLLYSYEYSTCSAYVRIELGSPLNDLIYGYLPISFTAKVPTTLEAQRREIGSAFRLELPSLFLSHVFCPLHSALSEAPSLAPTTRAGCV